MHGPDKNNFDALMEMLGETFSKPITELLKQSYWMALKDQPWEVVEACAKGYVKHGKFFPKPSELRPKGEKTVEQDGAEIERNEKFTAETWEQMRQRDPQQFWTKFKAAYLARLSFRFPVDSPQYQEAYQRCVARCEAELRNLANGPAVASYGGADDFF